MNPQTARLFLAPRFTEWEEREEDRVDRIRKVREHLGILPRSSRHAVIRAVRQMCDAIRLNGNS